MDLNTVNKLLSDAELGITLDTHLMDQLMKTTSTQLLSMLFIERQQMTLALRSG